MYMHIYIYIYIYTSYAHDAERLRPLARRTPSAGTRRAGPRSPGILASFCVLALVNSF